MAFLDNSGDIILDAVLTDTGRMRLAKGDGSFRVAKFALGDDEIDYTLYNYSHPSGTAYYDLEILQTPVLEAFSNNASSMKSKLISIAKNNLLYLPVLKINDILGLKFCQSPTLVNNGFVLATDSTTETLVSTTQYNAQSVTAFLHGETNTTEFIEVDQGIDSTDVPVGRIDPDLMETQYLIEVDNRFASIQDSSGNTINPSYIDDDNIATYYFSRGVETTYIYDLNVSSTATDQVISGPRGTGLRFKLKSKSDILINDYLFNTLGTDISTGFGMSAEMVRGILTNVRITGVTTGNVLDIPLMVVKVVGTLV